MSDRAFESALRLLALTTWLLYAATSRGTLSADPGTRFSVAENLVRHGTVTLPDETGNVVEHDGRTYSVFFPGQSVVFLPVAAAGVAAAKLGAGADTASNAARFVCAVFLMPLFGAWALVGFVRLLRDLEVGPRTALAHAALLAVATPMVIYGRSASEEIILAALAVWIFRVIVQARALASAGGEVLDDDDARRFVDRLGLAAVLGACGLIHRSTFVAILAAAAVIALPPLWTRRRWIAAAWPRATGWLLAAAAITALVPLYNWIRFDTPFDTGYARFWAPYGGIFTTPLLHGLHGHLTSPGKSVFLYVPWLVLLPVALLGGRARRRLGPSLLVAGAVLLAIHLLLYSRFTAWSGEFCWGVRFHVSIMPLLLVPIAVWADDLRRTAWCRTALGTLAAASILVQVAGSSLNWALEHYQHPDAYRGDNRLVPVDAAWTWRRSQLRLRFENIAAKLRGESLLEADRATGPGAIVSAWDFFPARAAAANTPRGLQLALNTLWAILLALAVLCAALTARAWPGVERDR